MQQHRPRALPTLDSGKPLMAVISLHRTVLPLVSSAGWRKSGHMRIEIEVFDGFDDRLNATTVIPDREQYALPGAPSEAIGMWLLRGTDIARLAADSAPCFSRSSALAARQISPGITVPGLSSANPACVLSALAN